MDKLISITEFTGKVCTFLEESYKNRTNLIITKHGKPYVYIGSRKPAEARSAEKIESTDEVRDNASEVFVGAGMIGRLDIARASITEYGCGCKKEDKNPLCERHGRY
jgi:hypothetical protein